MSKEQLPEEVLPEEVWVTLIQAGEEYTRYSVSNYGKVWDNQNGVEVAQVITGKPQYKYVNLYKDCGKRVLRRVNNIVSWSFHGEPPTPKHTSDHIDQDKFNNVEWNLRWADKRTQMQNRESTARMDCGTPVLVFVEKMGYDISQGVGQYIVNRLRKNDKEYLLDLIFDWAQYLNPYPKRWEERETNKGIEYENIWYPNLESFVKHKSNCSMAAYKDRLSKGLSVEEALTYEYDPADKYRFEMGGYLLTEKEHCDRLCVSHKRVSEYQKKRGLSFEEAVKVPVERVIKHNINGETRRNTEWYELYNIPARTANAWMVSKRSDGSSFNRTLRDVLEKYGVDTSDMIIYPCDGEVVMKNKPL